MYASSTSLPIIVRRSDDKDKRAYRIFLTEKGINHKNDVYKVAKSWEENLTKNLTTKEKDENKY